MTSDELLRVENLRTYFETKRGEVKAVDGVSFSLGKGRAVGLAGESGCGKTTAALSIMRLISPPGRIAGGKILFDGKDLVQVTHEMMRGIRWKEISMIFQGAMNSLNPVLNVGKQIVEAIMAHENVAQEDAWERARKLLGLVGMDETRNRDYAHELSGGMRQRVMIAMALACSPKLVIADEPTTALDVIVQAQVLELIKDLQKKLNLSTMLISHDLSMVAEMCDTCAIMYAGKIVEYGDIESIFLRPSHPYTKRLIASFPSIKGLKKGLETIPGAPPELINPPAGCRFNPRCRHTMDICRKDTPDMIEIEREHFAACHLLLKREPD